MSDFNNVKGTRDFSNETMIKRRHVLDTIRNVYGRYGFGEIETPIMEPLELLTAKGGGGEEIKRELYFFKDKSDRDIGLRFDLTMPMIRYFLNNPKLVRPFKRHDISRAWRYEELRPGRYREFWQGDVDIIGSKSQEAEAECLSAATTVIEELGFKQYNIRLNNRKILETIVLDANVPKDKVMEVYRSLDKYSKIGEEGVTAELQNRGIENSRIYRILESIKRTGDNFKILNEMKHDIGKSIVGMEGINELEKLLGYANDYGIKNIVVDKSLVRGMDYYTGPIYEINIVSKKDLGACGGGGRYDKLIETLGGPSTPAVGFSFGIERLIDIMDMENMFEPLDKTETKVYVANISPETRKFALNTTSKLRKNKISTDHDIDSKPFKKQLEYADKMRIRYVLIVGPKEAETGVITVKDMKTSEQEKLTIDEIIAKFKN